MQLVSVIARKVLEEGFRVAEFTLSADIGRINRKFSHDQHRGSAA